MPEFQMIGKDDNGFRSLPAFTRGYIEAAFFTAPDDEPDLSGCGFSDLHEDGLKKIVKDCDGFVKAHAADIAVLVDDETVDYDDESAGRDFWYDRNGYGVGFWDRGFEGGSAEAADRLSDASRACGAWDIEEALDYDPEDAPSP